MSDITGLDTINYGEIWILIQAFSTALVDGARPADGEGAGGFWPEEIKIGLSKSYRGSDSGDTLAAVVRRSESANRGARGFTQVQQCEVLCALAAELKRRMDS